MSRYLAFPAGRRAKWVVLVAWVVILMAAAPFAGKVYDAVDNDRLGYLPGKAESTAVLEAQEKFPAGRVNPAIMVYRREGGLTAADKRLAAADQRKLLAKYTPNARPEQPVVSQDGQALIYSVPLVAPSNKQEGAYILDSVDQIRDILGTPGGGLDLKVTGPAGRDADQFLIFRDMETTLLLVPVVVVAVLLLLIYRSPVLFLLPLLSVAVANQLGSAFIYGLIKNTDLVINSMSAGVLSILIYGAGTDYALLLIARYREELGRHEDRHEAMKEALRRSSGTIIASGATVGLGLLCLGVADLNATRALAPVGILAVVSAVFAMLTLLPALLVIFGRWVFWPKVPHLGDETRHLAIWHRVAGLVSTRPRLIWTVTTGVLALGLLGLTAFNVPQQTYFTKTPDSERGQTLISAHFPAGDSNPATVIANAAQAEPVRAAALASGAGQVQEVGRVGGKVQYTATLKAEPRSAAERGVVEKLRAGVHAVPGADAKVGGPAAIGLDQRDTNVRDSWLVIPLVLVVILLVLFWLLRAVTLSLMLIATVALSFGATLGISTLAFEYGFDWAGQDPQLPLLAFVFLVALGVDYNIFLMSRVREESARHGTHEGTLTALVSTGGVITSAGVVLAATFSVLVTLPVVGFAEQGLVIAAGVLIDTFIVRSLLVPALTYDFGDRVWWPSGLARGIQRTPAGRRTLQPEKRA
ncbi:MMPL family transporter [Actinomadura roseirufa]|uniref:MMPL family transporter n=1 Tax=Actinomadura roseirufa TaxID=2094049 RepID=UPI0010410B26|nr:MMPL family transporter [Actinomadura roseirufa]